MESTSHWVKTTCQIQKVYLCKIPRYLFPGAQSDSNQGVTLPTKGKESYFPHLYKRGGKNTKGSDKRSEQKPEGSDK